MNKEDIMNKARKDFLEGRINYKQFWKIFEDAKIAKQEPWKTKAWKTNREKKLKDKCECCGSTEKLIIQHTWHPRKFSVIAKQVIENNLEEFQMHMLSFEPSLIGALFENKECCPFCEGISIYYRQTTDDYRCNTQRRKNIPAERLINDDEFLRFQGLSWKEKKEEKVFFERRYRGIYRKITRCRAVFKKPSIVKYQTQTERKSISQAHFEHQKDFVNPIATKIWILEGQRYIELRDEDHITACRKCAYEQDKESGLIFSSNLGFGAWIVNCDTFLW